MNPGPVRKQKEMKPISLNYFTGHTKKIVYVFHSNGNFFDIMIFITMIQPKIYKNNGFLSRRICFHHVFILSCFLLQNIYFKCIFSLTVSTQKICSGVVERSSYKLAPKMYTAYPTLIYPPAQEISRRFYLLCKRVMIIFVFIIFFICCHFKIFLKWT